MFQLVKVDNIEELKFAVIFDVCKKSNQIEYYVYYI